MEIKAGPDLPPLTPPHWAIPPQTRMVFSGASAPSDCPSCWGATNISWSAIRGEWEESERRVGTDGWVINRKSPKLRGTFYWARNLSKWGKTNLGERGKIIKWVEHQTEQLVKREQEIWNQEMIFTYYSIVSWIFLREQFQISFFSRLSSHRANRLYGSVLHVIWQVGWYRLILYRVLIWI